MQRRIRAAGSSRASHDLQHGAPTVPASKRRGPGTMIDDEAFQRFIDAHAANFRTISGATRGEWKPDDVKQQAWLLAVDLGDKRERLLDIDDAGDASLLVRSL